ncbi:hypothetical protein ZWY2020_020616, partial [Hordeum vulgare]
LRLARSLFRPEFRLTRIPRRLHDITFCVKPCFKSVLKNFLRSRPNLACDNEDDKRPRGSGSSPDWPPQTPAAHPALDMMAFPLKRVQILQYKKYCCLLHAYIEKEDSQKLKQKQRERMQPKMGKMDIYYQVSHDAFFKYQTKPKLTNPGDLYYEGEEFEVKLTEMKPGMLSQGLKEALGIPEGALPPWLINMQISGLNAPIPPGATFGYRPGEWGKPPVDEHGRPLYGDVFGILQLDEPNYSLHFYIQGHYQNYNFHIYKATNTNRCNINGEEEELMEDEDMEAGMQSVDTMSSTPTGVETPEVIDLWKQQRKESERPTDKQLYQLKVLSRRRKWYLEPFMGQAICMWLGHKIKLGLKGLIFSRIKSPTKWMSPSILRSSKLWMMFWQPSTKQPGRRGSYGTRRKTSVTCWRRTRARGRGSTRRT